MISYLRATHYRPAIKQIDELQPGSWIRSERPNEDEKQQLLKLGIDADVLADALDPHEVPRVQLEDENYARQVNELTLLGRPGEAIEVANAGLFLASSESSYITATDIAVDGGIRA